MKRRGIALGLGLSVVLAAPAWGANATVRATEVNGIPGWDLTTVDVLPGETVTWAFDGMTQAHNVEAGSGNWALTSRVSLPAAPVSHTFPTEGTFHFICEVHPDTMFGDVRVASAPPPPPPPPPLSAQAFNNDDTTPLAAEKVTLDKSKPGLASLSARRVAKGAARVRFKVSEESDVSVAFKRGGKTAKSAVASGTGTRSVTVRGLRAGRYVVQVRATDIAGNRSKLRTLRLTVR